MAPTLVSLIIFKISENPFDYKLNDIPKHLQEKIIEAAYAIQILPFFQKKVKKFLDNSKEVRLKHKIVADLDDGEGTRHFYLQYYKKHKKNEKEEMRKRSLQQSDIQGSERVQETLL